MKIIRNILLILILFMIWSESYSADSVDEDIDIIYSREYLIGVRDNFIEENGDLLIKEIKIDGIRKTNRNIILKEAGILEGDRLTTFDPHRFVNRLNEKNIFSEINISYTKENEFSTDVSSRF